MTFLKLSSCFALKGVKGKSDKGKNAFFPKKAWRVCCLATTLGATSIWCASAATEEPLTPFEAALESNNRKAYQKAMLDQFLFWKQQLGDPVVHEHPQLSSTEPSKEDSDECSICCGTDAKLLGFTNKCTHYYCMGCIVHMVRRNRGMRECLYCPNCVTEHDKAKPATSPEPVTKGTILGFTLDPTFYAEYYHKDPTSIFQNYELAYHLYRKQRSSKPVESPEQSAKMKPRLKMLSSAEIEDIERYAKRKWKEEVENRRYRKDPKTIARLKAEKKASNAEIKQLHRDGKKCPKCGSFAIHYRGHACHHITCPNLIIDESKNKRVCGHQYCYVCLGPYLECGCPWQGSTSCNTIGYPSPYNGLMVDCGCTECPDCQFSLTNRMDINGGVIVEANPCDLCDASHLAEDGGPGGSSCPVCLKHTGGSDDGSSEADCGC